MLVTIIIFLIVLSILVFFHELGHFLFARLFRAKVLEFGLGLPPRAKKLFQDKHGTIFSLNWLPIGGFVAIAGENGAQGKEKADISPENKKSPPSDQLFYHLPARQRFAVLAAGPIFSLIFGLLAFILLFGAKGIPTSYDYPRLLEVAPDSPAAAAGLTPGLAIISVDTLLTTDGQISGYNYTDPSSPHHVDLDELIEFITSHPGQKVAISALADCPPDTNDNCTPLSPDSDSTNVRKYFVYVRTPEEIPSGQGAIGVTFSPSFIVHYPWYQTIPRAIIEGFRQSFLLCQAIILALGQLFSDLFSGQDVGNTVAGPVGIVNMVQKQGLFTSGFWAILSFAGMLSINLGVMNFLPFPALDGGRLLLIALEKVISRAKIARVEGALNTAGFVLLMAFMIIITFHDIINIIR